MGQILPHVTQYLSNDGLVPAPSVEIVSAQLGSRSAVEPLPHDRTLIANGKTWTANLTFPANTALVGQTAILRIKGQHKTGTFGGSYRVKMP